MGRATVCFGLQCYLFALLYFLLFAKQFAFTRTSVLLFLLVLFFGVENILSPIFHEREKIL